MDKLKKLFVSLMLIAAITGVSLGQVNAKGGPDPGPDPLKDHGPDPGPDPLKDHGPDPGPDPGDPGPDPGADPGPDPKLKRK